MSYGTYFSVAAAESTAIDTAAIAERDRRNYRAFLAARGVSDSVFAAWFAAPMLAVRDAPISDGPFPLVLLAQGNGQSAVDQSVLGEYLASYGYIIATTPSQARIDGRPRDEADVGHAAEDQADDLALARGALRGRPDLRADRTAVMGHSFGARSALLLMMRDRSIGAFVSLDGGIGTATAQAPFKATRSFSPTTAGAPVLHFYEELDTLMTPDFGILSSLASPEVWLAKASELHHHHFSSLAAAGARFPELGKATNATAGTAPQYAAVLHLTLAFLDATMTGDASDFHDLQKTPAPLSLERLPKP